jgi:hypothetical protein
LAFTHRVPIAAATVVVAPHGNDAVSPWHNRGSVMTSQLEEPQRERQQEQAPDKQVPIGIGVRLGSLVIPCIALGVRLARLQSPVVAGLAVAGGLGVLGLLLEGITLASRRRVARAQASWPEAMAVSASVNAAAMMAPGTVQAERGIRMLTVTALLLPDRLILVPRRSTTRHGAMVERDLLFDHVRAASWSTSYTGVKQIPVLQLTGKTGDPVVIRVGAGSRRATVDFVAATKAVLARWLPAPALSESSLGLTKAQPLSRAGTKAAVALIVLSVAGGYLGGAVVIAKASSGPSANRWIRPERAIGVNGYYTYGGPHGRPIATGAPWGRPCKPILVRVEESVPDAAYWSFVEVVHEARAAGVDIAITKRNGDFTPSELYPQGQHLDTVHTADVFADNKAPTRLASGALDHEDLGWDAVLSPDGRREYVTDLNIRLHLSVLGVNPTAFRKAALGFVGFTQGIGVSTAPGTAFASESSLAADKFSAQDIKAMLTMSGCATTSPATGTAA